MKTSILSNISKGLLLLIVFSGLFGLTQKWVKSLKEAEVRECHLPSTYNFSNLTQLIFFRLSEIK